MFVPRTLLVCASPSLILHLATTTDRVQQMNRLPIESVLGQAKRLSIDTRSTVLGVSPLLMLNRNSSPAERTSAASSHAVSGITAIEPKYSLQELRALAIAFLPALPEVHSHLEAAPSRSGRRAFPPILVSATSHKKVGSKVFGEFKNARRQLHRIAQPIVSKTTEVDRISFAAYRAGRA